ncbi:hypothetical protein B0H65DRAFT_467399 [Neurospora tetraspora]|uniref:Uncharacterized protein n=1 Tax=Neurospora tetraspora TaxID=94610 RepID=A0AAE0JG45_9PEZI|nr:hypothetical protein B0H65DRAFT_467399 [Neurospora tetraspora]
MSIQPASNVAKRSDCRRCSIRLGCLNSGGCRFESRPNGSRCRCVGAGLRLTRLGPSRRPSQSGSCRWVCSLFDWLRSLLPLCMPARDPKSNRNSDMEHHWKGVTECLVGDGDALEHSLLGGFGDMGSDNWRFPFSANEQTCFTGTGGKSSRWVGAGSNGVVWTGRLWSGRPGFSMTCGRGERFWIEDSRKGRWAIWTDFTRHDD